MSHLQPIDTSSLFDTLCPMHVILNGTGHIVHAGPTMCKLRPDNEIIGTRFLDLFELKRPRIGNQMADLLSASGRTLHLQLRTPPRIELKAVLSPLPTGSCLGPDGGAVVNLSFGISIVEAVQNFDLSSRDFAATELTVEMLYLVEAKSAAMEASRKLNLRLQGAKIAAEEQAFTDTLTGLKNRRAMDHIQSRLHETEAEYALMNVDLDFFKAVNDTYGHAAGDYVLQTAARLMVEETRREDTVIRTGGDEFVVLFSGLLKPEKLLEIGQRLIKRLEQPITFQNDVCQISASIGATRTAEYADPTSEQMLEDADIALYAAKNGGRGQVKVFAPEMREG